MVIGRVWIKVELVSSSDAVFVFVYKWYRELQGDGVIETHVGVAEHVQLHLVSAWTIR